MQAKIDNLIKLFSTDADAAVVMSEHHRRYFTGVHTTSGMVIVTKNDAYFVTDSRYIEMAKHKIKHMECIECLHLYDFLKELGEKQALKKVVVESESLTVGQYEAIRRALPDAEVDTTKLDGYIDALASVKTAEECRKIAAAQAFTDAGFAHILNYIKVGKTEKEVAFELEFFMRKQGADALAFDTIAVSGANGSLPHGEPSDKPLQYGDFFTMDFGAMIDGWNSDMTRTVCVGGCSEQQREAYDTVLAAQLAGLSAVKAGVTTRDADNAVRDVINAAGYGEFFRHGTGHGVGLRIHEAPYLSPFAAENTLVDGNVVTVEPGIYLPGKFGVRIEDMVVVRENGCDNFTKSPKELIIL